MACSMSSWDNCFPEILYMIFKKLPPHALATCMYVNKKWNFIASNVIECQNKWNDVCEAMIPYKGNDLKLKCHPEMNYKELFFNFELWNHLNKAEVKFQSLHTVDSIKRVNVYRDNLIAVTYHKVIYYDCETFHIRKTLEISCRDFIENDHMIAVVKDGSNRCMKLNLHKKASVEDFDIDETKAVILDNVILYRIEKKKCYVFDDQNTFSGYGVFYPIWAKIYSIRYYGNLYECCYLHSYNNQVFLMLKCGKVFYANPFMKSFVKILVVPPPLLPSSSTIFAKMFHKCGFIYGVPASESYSFSKTVVGMNEVNVYHCPRLSCVLSHGDMIIMGYLNGVVEFRMPRLISENSLIRRFNIKDFNPHITDLEIMSMDVFENKGMQHLFIATISQIIQLNILYENCHEDMFKVQPKVTSIIPEFCLQYRLN